jgi:MinD-like ATPase involved in chromosome partitioning or flagellar assembly
VQSNNIIIDCHGAHDLWTLGAIFGASDLVTVTTPDSGSYEGTVDLLSFVARLRAESMEKSQKDFLNRSMLVMNFYRDAERGVTQHYKKLTDSDPYWPKQIVEIPGNSRFHQKVRGYQFGRLMDDSGFAEALKPLTDALDSQQASKMPPAIATMRKENELGSI